MYFRPIYEFARLMWQYSCVLQDVERNEILAVLRSESAAARMHLNQASEYFDSIIRETPSRIPNPDGKLRVMKASRDLAAARMKFMDATTKLNDFVIHGTIPPDLKKL